MADPAAAAPAPEASSSSPTPETNDNGNAASTIGDHPSLQPALHLQITIGPATPIGSVSRGTPLTVVPLVAGTLVSEPGFPLHVNASMRGQGVDYVHNDPDGGRMRLKSDLVVGYVRRRQSLAGYSEHCIMVFFFVESFVRFAGP
jgi:hypothetical protein